MLTLTNSKEKKSVRYFTSSFKSFNSSNGDGDATAGVRSSTPCCLVGCWPPQSRRKAEKRPLQKKREASGFGTLSVDSYGRSLSCCSSLDRPHFLE